MCVITEKKKFATKHRLAMLSKFFYHLGYFNWGGPGPLGPPLATPMSNSEFKSEAKQRIIPKYQPFADMYVID